MMMKKLMYVVIAVVLGLGSGARAQDDAMAIIDASRKAIKNTEGFTAQFRMFGEGGAAIKSMLPTMSGQMVFGDLPEHGRAIRLLGAAREKEDSVSKPLDILKTNDMIAWVNHDLKTVNEHPSDTRVRGAAPELSTMIFDVLIRDDPYGERLDTATSIVIEESEEIAGVMCDVIRVDYAKAAAGRRSGGALHNAARWHIGKDDHLPRKITQITTGMLKIRMIMEISNLKQGAQPENELNVDHPKGFEVKSTLKADEPGIDPELEGNAAPAGNTPANNGASTQAKPRAKYAPAFAFADASGAKVSSETQKGRITVLYFMGSWSLPCNEISPKVSELADSLTDFDVDVFAIAVRERDEDSVRSGHERAAYTHRLVTGADDTARDFKIRLYPTIVIVNANNEIVYTGHLAKDFGAVNLLEAAASNINEELKTMINDG